jgi:hypothetical protein
MVADDPPLSKKAPKAGSGGDMFAMARKNHFEIAPRFQKVVEESEHSAESSKVMATPATFS